MPQIIVTTDPPDRGRAGAVTLRERVTEVDFESDHSARQLLERLFWAVGDAHEVPQDARPAGTSAAQGDAPGDGGVASHRALVGSHGR